MTTNDLSLVFNIVNAVGSLGTFGGFLFLFIKDKGKEKQIKELSSLATTFSKQYELSVKKINLLTAPNLWLNGGSATGATGELTIDLNNKGEVAFLDDIRLISGAVILHNLHIPYELEKEKRRLIFARANTDKSINNSEYEIELDYHDKLNNKFTLSIEGIGSQVRITKLVEK